MRDQVSGPLNVEQGKQVGFIHRSGQDLLRLIEGILTSARIEADKIEVVRLPTDLEATLRGVVESCSPLIASKGLTVDVVLDPSLSTLVAVDEEKLKLVIGNLLSNAIKFTPDAGRIELCARARPGAGGEAPGELELVVKDDGIGIAPEHHGLIFEEFRQVDGSITRRFGGTGLGLSLARKLTERMDGTLTVDSDLGHGATFHVRLPLGRGTPTAPK
jgi:signal transduction histidine kinase